MKKAITEHFDVRWDGYSLAEQKSILAAERVLLLADLKALDTQNRALSGELVIFKGEFQKIRELLDVQHLLIEDLQRERRDPWYRRVRNYFLTSFARRVLEQ